MDKRGRRCKHLLDDLEIKTRECGLLGEELDRTLWRTRFGRGNRPVVRQKAEEVNNRFIGDVDGEDSVMLNSPHNFWNGPGDLCSFFATNSCINRFISLKKYT